MGFTGSEHAATGIRVRLFLIIIIAFHLFDVFTRYSGNNSAGIRATIITMHILLIFGIAPALLDRDGWFGAYKSGRVIIYLLVSVVAYLLPILISLFGDKIVTIINSSFWANLAFAITSPWIAFLIFSSADDSWVRFLRVAWVVTWVILMVISLINIVPQLGAALPTTSSKLNINPVDTFKEMWSRISSAGKNSLRTMLGLPDKVRFFVNKNLEDSLGYSFSGQVDSHGSEDLGVRFTDVRTIQSSFNDRQPVVVWADMQGESFTDIIHVNLRCYAVDNDNPDKTVDGVITTGGMETNQVTIKLRQKISMQCTFKNLSAGYYTVHVAGAFNFQTWAYVPYYFSPQDYVMSVWEQNADPAQSAGIDKRPTAIYTNGPIELGLASEYDQPIPLDTADPLSSLPPFGASITNVWADGEVQSLRNLSLMVPAPFELRACDQDPSRGDRVRPLPQDPNAEYREYVFGNLQDGNYYPESVTCFVGIEGNTPEAMTRSAEKLLGGFQLVMKTFGAKVSYVYNIHDQVDVTVKKWGAR